MDNGMTDHTLTPSQKIIGGFAPHWALVEEGLEIDWSVAEVRRQAWELINALADQLDFYRQVLLGATVVTDEMIERAARIAENQGFVSPTFSKVLAENMLRAALEVTDE